MRPKASLLLLQMAGAPGSGKSALALSLGQTLGAVVLDKDVIKSALLEAEVGWEAAGAGSNEALFAVADSILSQGLSVVLDSPSHYPGIPERGMALATARGARYRFIECVCEDLDEIRRRLDGRVRRRSQWRGLEGPAPDGNSQAEQIGPHRWRTYGPADGWLVRDTKEPLAASLEAAQNYLLNRPASDSSPKG